ncbi:EAL domain-containing protein [Pacificimonas aurantium]|nr:EAL domain-containing protein [Pacificimonas aurantium]
MELREAAERRERELARHDTLTGLSNRRVLMDALQSLGGKPSRGARQMGLFLIDLDRFKPVNDLHGHGVGDRVLVEIADRLRATVPAGSIITRLGGDEFVCVVSSETEDELSSLGRKIVSALSRSIHLGAHEVKVGASIGVSRIGVDACEPEEILRTADIAMYEAKADGGGACRFFCADMDENLRARSAFEDSLRLALSEGQIVPYFQPVIDLRSNRVASFEALARWEHPERGTLAPASFLPHIEEMGLLGLLTESILRKSCEAAQEWPEHVAVSVNVAPQQFQDPWFSTGLLDILSQQNFPPQRLIIELVESAVLENSEAARAAFDQLHAAGVRIALDDFGKGYSSLSNLRSFAFDYMKLDASLVNGVGNAQGNRLIDAITYLSQALNLPITAEGVETHSNALALRLLGCDLAQGYHFGKPMDALAAAQFAVSKPIVRRTTEYPKVVERSLNVEPLPCARQPSGIEGS